MYSGLTRNVLFHILPNFPEFIQRIEIFPKSTNGEIEMNIIFNGDNIQQSVIITLQFDNGKESGRISCDLKNGVCNLPKQMVCMSCRLEYFCNNTSHF